MVPVSTSVVMLPGGIRVGLVHLILKIHQPRGYMSSYLAGHLCLEGTDEMLYGERGIQGVYPAAHGCQVR